MVGHGYDCGIYGSCEQIGYSAADLVAKTVFGACNSGLFKTI